MQVLINLLRILQVAHVWCCRPKSKPKNIHFFVKDPCSSPHALPYSRTIEILISCGHYLINSVVPQQSTFI